MRHRRWCNFAWNQDNSYKLLNILTSMKLLGIDDAGRGPVIGPMTLAGVIIDEKDESKIKTLNARDSKLLTPSQRRKIAEQLRPNFTYKIVTSSPKQIDDSSNLN